MSGKKITRNLNGDEERLAGEVLDFMSEFGIKGIQLGSRKIAKKGKKIVETRSVRKTNKK